MLKVTNNKPHTPENTADSGADAGDSSGSSEVDSLTEDLDQIGRFNLPKFSTLMGDNFPRLRNFTSNLPPFGPNLQTQFSIMSNNLSYLSQVNLPTFSVNSRLPDLPDVSRYISQSIKQLSRYSDPDNSGEAAAYSDHGQVINSIKTTVATRLQMNTFLADLRSGSSFQVALDRLQTLTDLVHEAITLPVEDDEETEPRAPDTARDQDTEPVGVLRVVNREQPFVNDLVVPDDDNPGKKRAKKGLLCDAGVYDSGANTTDWEVPELTPTEAQALTQLDRTEDFFKQDLLRSKIQDIQRLDLSQHSKNKLVTKLMMGNYLNYVGAVSGKDEQSFSTSSGQEKMNMTGSPNDSNSNVTVDSNNVSSVSAQLLKMPDPTNGSEVPNSSVLGASNGQDTSSLTSEGSEDEVVLSETDIIPSFFDTQKNILGCQHYQRNCKLECATCQKWFVCRFCHDAEVSDHKLVRKDVEHILCMHCCTPQAPETSYCVNCEEELANYFCLKCVLYDNDPQKEIYHCDKCGICRLGVGLSKDYFHCDTCNICLSIDLKHNHKCVTNTTHCDCPICNEYLFTSVSKVVFMKCGHSIHQQCYDEMTKHSYKCPICKKTVVNTETQFRILDQEIRQSPLPAPYDKWRCIISCNDCKGKSNCAYHVMGLKCKYCQSYNTNQLKLSKPEESDDESDVEQDDNDAHITSMRLIKTNLSSNFLMDDQTTRSSVELGDDLMKLKSGTDLDRSSIASIFQKFINSTLINFDDDGDENGDSDMDAFGF